MRSRTMINHFKAWYDQAPYDDANFVDKVYFLAEKSVYDGDILTAYTPDEILREFKTLDDVRRALGTIGLN